MAVAFFPDMDGQGVEAGWTPRNMGLKRQGHSVGANMFDVVIHFADCAKCEADAEALRWDREAAFYLVHMGTTVADIYGEFAYAEDANKASRELRAIHRADRSCHVCAAERSASNDLPFE